MRVRSLLPRVPLILVITAIAACDPARPLQSNAAPVPPAPVTAESRAMVLQALLKTHSEHGPVDHRTAGTLLRLVTAVEKAESPSSPSADAPESSPAIEKGLRQLMRIPGDSATMLRVMREVAAEQAESTGNLRR